MTGPPSRAALWAAISAAGSISNWVGGEEWTLRAGSALSIRFAVPNSNPQHSFGAVRDASASRISITELATVSAMLDCVAVGDSERIIQGVFEVGGERLDKALASASGLSRERVKALLSEGRVAPMLQGSAKTVAGMAWIVRVPEAAPAAAMPQDIPLNVVFEDEHLIVVDKPAGLVVHPAAGNLDGTLVNALLHHCRGQLSGIGGVARPGIVHRIDKDTSGLLVVAKTDAAHLGLAEQFAAHSIERAYRAVCAGHPRPPSGTIRGAIARSSANRKKMAPVQEGRGKHAVTHFRTLQALDHATDLECALETGRTHQVRVHLASIGHPLLGDPVYGRTPSAIRPVLARLGFRRQALHAARLGFIHPVTGREHKFESPLPVDMTALLVELGGNAEGFARR